jgi:hypothetical protein
LFDFIFMQKASGMKQDPLMLGHNFNVAETMARVILAKLGTQIANYQRLVASYLEDMFKLRLELLGYTVKNVYVAFEKPMLGDQVREQDARGKKIDNLIKEYDQGIIDQTQLAQELDRDEPAEEEPRKKPTPDGGDDPNDPDDPTDGEDATDPKTTDAKAKVTLAASRIGGKSTVYPYRMERLNNPFKFDDDLMEEHFRAYFNATNKNYDKAVAKSVQKIIRALGKLDNEAYTAEMVADNVLFNLYKDWGDNFVKPQEKIIRRNIADAYTAFRKDSTIVAGVADAAAPSLDLLDIRAIEYFKASDNLYLGKFITDPDLKSSINKYIKDNYLEGDMPIGRNTRALNKFKSEFGDVLQGKNWKIQQILSTTVNKMRNSAALLYMKDAGVSKFQFVGVADSRQSDFCIEIDGRTFEVENAVKAVETEFNSDPSDVRNVRPFGTTIVKAEDMKQMSDSDLQAAGVQIPPFHPECRTNIIAVI